MTTVETERIGHPLPAMFADLKLPQPALLVWVRHVG